ncbi:LruC domain-containing protein [Emticicia sp. SJ17W-69]|uniref:LruC domain-containing protein n=1 Tax=Emticicia sp. SJ17W-69 TaxID=3421657 RepID=UPI003EBB9E06
MKFKNYLLFIYFLGLNFWLISCVRDFEETTLTKPKSAMESLNVPSTFVFKTTADVKFDIGTFDNLDKPMKGVVVSIYSYPEDKLLLKGVTSASGVLQINQAIPTAVKQVSVRPNRIGLPNEFIVDVSNNGVKAIFGGKNQTTPKTLRVSSDDETISLRNAREISGKYPIKTLGTWSKEGVPNYLEGKRDDISAEFLANIDASVPERKPVTEVNPGLLKSTNKTVLTITELADVWITFVHEGAGWTNTLGFYTFDLKKPPTNVSDISAITIVFPNVSYSGSGGGLTSGDKVKIGQFPAGTGIGFVLFASGFNGSKGEITDGSYAHFSHEALNIESKEELRRHLIVLNDPTTNRLLLSFEDVNRESASCDQDFNDAIFYATSNPVKAISRDDIPVIINPKDTDGDGLSDNNDEYPTDSDKSYSNFTPSSDTYSSLAYEDLWPFKGDYDMNDMVVNYQFEEVFNAANQVIEIRAKVYVKAILANIQSGWGFQLPIPASAVKSVTGQYLKNNVISNGGNGTESGQEYATIIAFDNGVDIYNAVKPQELNLRIILSTPINKSTLGTAPYNPFIFQTKDRGNEVHLINQAPTQKANKSLLGTGDDRSNGSSNIFYRSDARLPWSINIPEDFKHPLEAKPIVEGYLFFKDWVESDGKNYPDWYLDKKGYRDATKLSN